MKTSGNGINNLLSQLESIVPAGQANCIRLSTRRATHFFSDNRDGGDGRRGITVWGPGFSLLEHPILFTPNGLTEWNHLMAKASGSISSGAMGISNVFGQRFGGSALERRFHFASHPLRRTKSAGKPHAVQTLMHRQRRLKRGSDYQE